MSKYKKGVETNSQIILTAKRLFSIDGFKKTTISSICKTCDIKLGTFTYYYSKKEDLLSTIYSDYMQACRQFINQQSLSLSSLEHHIYVVALYYYNIYYNPIIFRFHNEILSLTSMNNVFKHPETMIDDFTIESSKKKDEHYDLFVRADNAVRREFNLIYFNKESHTMDDVKELLACIYMVAARIFSVDEHRILKIVEDAYLYAKEKGDHTITLL